MSEWQDYRIAEPKERSYCYVCNIDDTIHCFLAKYIEKQFLVFDPGRQRELPIKVTHFVQLPDTPYPIGRDD